jgi:hypothetical protein
LKYFLVTNLTDRLEQEVVIHFRWSPPAKSNGELTGYRIHFCHDGTPSDDCQDFDVSAGATEFIAPNLVMDDNYTFTVGPLKKKAKLKNILQ